MYLKDLLQWAIDELRLRSVDTARLDAEVLMAHVLKRNRLELYLDPGEPVDKMVESHFRTLIGKRSAYAPVSYLTGHKEFMSLDFVVNEGVLIPRPETEILVETVCELGEAGARVLELGTGSGAVAVSVAKYKPDWRVAATDISMKALLVAQRNACNHQVIDRISFLQCDLLSALSLSSRFDCVVSNPPYISARALTRLHAGIRKYEPIIALDGGTDGLDLIRRIIAEAYLVLKPGGLLALEIGYEQGESTLQIADRSGEYSDCSLIKDYSGNHRVFRCRRRVDGG